jgi:phosphatidylserine decarboxylase
MLIRTYSIDVSEVERPVEEYHSLQQFFSRRLLAGARLPHPKCALVSPCDGELLQVGRLSSDGMLLQVKGDLYHARDLLQNEVFSGAPRHGVERIYFLFHLRPKDYHRFHSPADLAVQEVVHIPGTLHPVTYTSSKWIPALFAKNERVTVLAGWQHGAIAVVPVGATCVGSISLEFEPRVKTNGVSSKQNVLSLFQFASGGAGADESSEKGWTSPRTTDSVFPPLETTKFKYDVHPSLRKGEEMGWFNWGSAIVIIADVPDGCGVRVRPMEEVRVGQPLINWN